jgi:hypothetical protein
MVLPPLQPTLGAYVNLLFHRFDKPEIGASAPTKQKKQPATEMPPTPSPRPSVLVTAPTFTPPIPPLATKPVQFSQTVMSGFSPSSISPNTRKLVDTLYEGVEPVLPSDKQVVPIVDDKEVVRGRLTSMPSASDFRAKASPTPSPSRPLSIRTARPVSQPFRSLKTHGFYIRSGRILIPGDGSLVVFTKYVDTFYLYLGSNHVATVRCDVDFEAEDFPFEVSTDRWVLPPGDYLHDIDCDFTVTVPTDSIYTIDSYLPA